MPTMADQLGLTGGEGSLPGKKTLRCRQSVLDLGSTHQAKGGSGSALILKHYLSIPCRVLRSRRSFVSALSGRSLIRGTTDAFSQRPYVRLKSTAGVPEEQQPRHPGGRARAPR